MEQLNLGKTILLEIDVQGARQVQKNYPDGVFIFLLPPSIEELKRRITGRNSETEENIQKRLSIVNDELESGKSYNYVVVNDEVERAVDEICAILDAESLKVGRNLSLFDELVKNS